MGEPNRIGQHPLEVPGLQERPDTPALETDSGEITEAWAEGLLQVQGSSDFTPCQLILTDRR